MALRQKSAKLRLGDVTLPQTLSNAFPSAPTVGQTVFFICSHYGNSNLTGVTIAGAAATLDRRDSFGAQIRMDVWRATVPASPNRNIVLSGANGGHYITGAAIEVDALASSPLDAQGVFDGNAVGTTYSVSTSGATTQADELVIAQWTAGFGSSDIGTDTAPGYSEMYVEDDSNTYQGGAGGYKFVSATGVQSASWPLNESGASGYAHIVTYKTAGAPPEGTSGTLAVTLDAATLAATGVAVNTATLAVNLAATTLSASGASPVEGSLAVTLADATLVASGVAINNATLAVTLDNTLLVATGAATNNATLAVTLDNTTLSASSESANTATLAVTLDNTTLSTSVLSEHTATLAAQLGDTLLTATASGVVTASLAVTLDAATLSATGSSESGATLAVLLDNATLVASSESYNTGTLAVTLDDTALQAVAAAEVSAVLAVLLDDTALQATAVAPVSASLAVQLADTLLQAIAGSEVVNVRLYKYAAPDDVHLYIAPDDTHRYLATEDTP